ncbi:kinase-like domain-containing protein [Xylaria curta]|nr:kinase-like domain-containing protein [Xylaria curta]
MMDLIYDELHDNQIDCPLGNKWYIPIDVLRKTITPERVLELMDTQETEQDMYNIGGRAKGIVRYSMRAFATLVLVGRSNPIQDIISNGFIDEHLPLAREASGDRRCLFSIKDNRKIFKLSEDWKRPEVTAFLEKQWLFQAPILDTRGNHLLLDPECAMPLRKPIEEIGSTESSRVFTCEIHPAHYQDDSQDHKGQVAIKEIRSAKSFRLEQKNLAAIQDLNNPHLIKHIVTCQRDTLYYVVFPLADGGSLLSYWEQKSKVQRSGELILWALKQMLGLADAMKALHHDLEGLVHLRHGDLKPANILHFEKSGSSSLVIADLGVSSIHDKPTNQRIGETMTKATTRSYEAPEAYDDESKNKPRSRTYDVWSLGCVFLEFTIWLLYDFDAIKNFENNRLAPHENPHASFYELRAGKAAVPKAVKQAIDALNYDPRLRDGSVLRPLVHLIADKLLVTVVKNRFDAKKLYTELQEIVQRAEQTPSSLLREADLPQYVPEIFDNFRNRNS